MDDPNNVPTPKHNRRFFKKPEIDGGPSETSLNYFPEDLGVVAQ